MKKSILMCLGFAAFLLLASSVGAALVKCGGTACGGSGTPWALPAGVTWLPTVPLDYLYEVTIWPGDHWHVFQVGTDDGNLSNYGLISHSSNWGAIGGALGTLVLNPFVPEADIDTFTPHGAVSPGPTGTCPHVVQWRIPAGDDSTADVYYFGFNNPNPPHDVGGTIYTQILGFTWDEDWLAPVGFGQGPLHGPFVPEPTTGILLFVAALAAAGRSSRDRR